MGPRLRELRRRRGTTLADLAELTGFSISTLSRLESGKRRPTLEFLVPLARAYRVPLDDLVGAPETGDPRVHLRPRNHRGRTIVPLTRYPGPLQAYKQILPGRDPDQPLPEPVVHDGYEWLYVLSGELRLILGDHDVVLRPGEVAEFDTHVPHWFASASPRPTEILNLFGPQGERAHITAVTGRRQSPVGTDDVDLD
ncbi:helix-turn-helix domain-containing protein [Pseudonocardia sp. HH130630-07]|uniref:helix-turn-helix domain-containing protein n=1 Tax=Pseudonocardia sp. HH130630-07 TaxID=1690815 RepID=UPI001E5E7AA1|nr:XRE family transcriptional regulator [Pseudonocardia sp. HH130630-07]